MPRKRDRIDDLISAGAFIVKPKPAVTPEPVPEPATAPKVQPESVAEAVVDIADAVAQLDRCWHSPDPRETTEIPVTGYGDYGEEGPEPVIGSVLDLVVVAFSHNDPTGQSRGGIGLARIPRGSRRKGRRDGCHFRDLDIISEGVETLRPGSRIRARLAEAISTAHPFSLRDIEVYRD